MNGPTGAATLDLDLLDEPVAVARLTPDAAVPAWASSGRFASVTRTPHELSIVCSAGAVPPDVRAERGWRVLAVRGPLAFSLTGILTALVRPLAEQAIPVFALSTFDTDYLLVRDTTLADAIASLRAAGHRVHD